MKKIYALFMTLCLIISATAAPLAGVAKKSYPLYQPEVVKAELAPSMHKAPAATQGLQYDAEAGELIRYYNETDQIAIDADYLAQGNLYIDIMAGDKSDYLTLLLFVEDTVEGAIIPEGTYPITSTPAYNTAIASQGYVAGEGVYPCAYYPLVEQGGTLYINTPMYFMQSGNIVVEHVNGAPKITINAVNSNNVPMTIVFEIGGKSEKVEVKTPLKYDATAADGALDYTFAEGATATATDKSFYGTYVVDAADASCELGLLFIYPEGTADAETTIPAGTYTISDSQAPGTVMASSGYSSQGLGYSFFINIDAEGYIELPMYFLVEGTVEVTKVDGKLKVEVNALNSNDVPVHVVYDATSAEPEYEVYEDAITNLVIDYDNLLLIGGPSDAFQVEVVLGLGECDRNTDAFQLLPASTISVLGSEATFVDGYASVDGIEQSATAVVHCTWNGMAIEFHLTMTSAPMEATVVVVENAKVEIEKVLLFGDMYDYALKMTGVWTNEGIDYPVLVEVPVYYPEATEPSEIYSTVTVGGNGEDDPWLGFGEGTLTVTTVDDVVTATGIVENPAAGIAIDITISGSITTTGVENATVTVKSVKMIQNGQLIIKKGDAQFNAQGATLK